jgi:hypothetical protein
VRATLSCTVLALLGACASTQWAKDGGETADPQVLSECSQQAWGRTQYAQMSGASVPVQAVQQGKSGLAPTANSNSVRFPQSDVQEQMFFNLCMREKGYDLVPAAPDQ